MAKKHEGLSFKEHQRIGKQILKLRQDLRKLDLKIAEAYGKTSPSAKQAERLLRAWLSFRASSTKGSARRIRRPAIWNF